MKRAHILIFIIFLFGYALRVLFLPSNALTFGYDQARDAIISESIAKGDLKILGPSASVQGLYHGVFYYYVLAPAYYLGNGSPIIAAYWIAFLNAVTIFLVYIFAFRLTNSKKTAIFSAFSFAISFELVQYATWLSNPTIAVVTVPLMYFGLWSWVHDKKRWGAVIAGLGLGLSIQSEIFLLYHAVVILFWLIVARRQVTRKDLLRFIIATLAAVSTMILSEVKFGFKSIGGFSQLVATQDPIGYNKSFGDIVTLYLNQIGRVFAYSTYPGNVGYGAGIVMIIAILTFLAWHKKQTKVKNLLSWETFLLSWIFSHALVVSIGGTSTPFLLVGIAPAVCMLIGAFLTRLLNEKQIIVSVALVAFIVFGNITTIFKENPHGQTIFSIQKDMLLSKQLKAIDYTYKEGKPFSINTLTSPLWIDIVWAYLYKWYGGPRYGFLPTWHGRDQIGQLITLPPDEKLIKNYYLIIEPMAGIPMRYLDETIGEEDSYSIIMEDTYFGDLRVQKRLKL
jgi:4-amino-4-deoxy-L-arabinose transferase-like glycosyltransferase